MNNSTGGGGGERKGRERESKERRERERERKEIDNKQGNPEKMPADASPGIGADREVTSPPLDNRARNNRVQHEYLKWFQRNKTTDNQT